MSAALKNRADLADIKVTPAMIDAGFATLAAGNVADDLLEADREVVREIFLSMLRQFHQDAQTYQA